MKTMACLFAVAVLLAGCAGEQRAASDAALVQPGMEAPAGGDAGPVDDTSLARADADGRTPPDVVSELVETLNRREWESAYSQYAAPYVEYEQALQDWESGVVHHENFEILETRVERDDLAFVRVIYGSMAEPGEWWAVDKVDGRWKTRWMPAQ